MFCNKCRHLHQHSDQYLITNLELGNTKLLLFGVLIKPVPWYPLWIQMGHAQNHNWKMLTSWINSIGWALEVSSCLYTKGKAKTLWFHDHHLCHDCLFLLFLLLLLLFLLLLLLLLFVLLLLHVLFILLLLLLLLLLSPPSLGYQWTNIINT